MAEIIYTGERRLFMNPGISTLPSAAPLVRSPLRSATRAFVLAVAGLLVLPPALSAHSGHGLEAGFWEGLLHPFTGLDHMLALVVIGLWAAQMGGTRRAWVPLVALAGLLSGALMALASRNTVLAEAGIIASLLLAGVLVALAVRPPLAVTAFCVAGFVLIHGYAHGLEVALSHHFGYWLGFLAGSLVCLVGSVSLGHYLKESARPHWVRVAGGAIALGGLVFWTL
jgi:urease accessory protein